MGKGSHGASAHPLLVVGEGDVDSSTDSSSSSVESWTVILVRIDLHIFADHVEDILLELGQVIQPPLDERRRRR